MGLREVVLDGNFVVDTFAREAEGLNWALENNPKLRPFFNYRTSGVDREALKQAYMNWLKLTAEYVRFTLPMLEAAAETLSKGDEEDKAWGERMSHFAAGERDKGYGHEIWALNDLRALGASEELINAPPPWTVKFYGDRAIEIAGKEPYSIMARKGVLERLSILNSPRLSSGLIASGILPPYERKQGEFDEEFEMNAMRHAEQFMTFVVKHGILDFPHTQQGEAAVRTIKDQRKLLQMLEGAFFTSGSYRAIMEHI